MMFRKLNLIVIAATVLALGGIYGSAALTSIAVDRTLAVSVGVDSAAGTGVRITCADNTGDAPAGNNYTAVCAETNGVVALNLGFGLNTAAAKAFNYNGTYTIGTNAANGEVVVITNNTSYQITVQLNASDAGVVMKTADVANTNATTGTVAVAPGTSQAFYFTVATPANSTGSMGTYTLQIR